MGQDMIEVIGRLVIDGAEDEGWAAGDSQAAIRAAIGKLQGVDHIPDPEARRCILRQAASAIVGALAHEAVVATQDASKMTPALEVA